MRFLPRRVLALVGLSLVGCTFAGLADYETPECNPDLPLAEDGCNQLNVGNTSCQRYQCDRATKRCVVGILDEDRDNDPPIACGGTDCDDHDPTRSGKATEICDGIDNNCNGLTDENLLVEAPQPEAPITDVMSEPRITTVNGRELYATYLGASGCVHSVALGTESDAGACALFTVADDAAAPVINDPQALPVGTQNNSTTGFAFAVRNSTACAGQSQLAFANAATKGRAILADCDAVNPSLASFPNLTESIIAFYDSDGALKLRWVDRPTTDKPDLTTSVASNLGKGTSTRPALVPVDGGTAVLLAAPSGSSVGLWSLTPDGRIIPLATSIPALDGAKNVALAIGRQGSSKAQIAIVGGGAIVTADFDVVSGSLVGEFRALKLQQAPGESPAITWVESAKEWWLTSHVGPTTLFQRITDSGSGPAIAGTSEISGKAAEVGAVRNGAGDAGAKLTLMSNNTVREIGFRCK